MNNRKIGTCKECQYWHPPKKYTPGTCSTRTGAWDADEFCNLWEQKPNQFVDGMKQKYFKFMEGGGHD